MKNSKAYLLFKTLDKKEIQRLRKNISSSHDLSRQKQLLVLVDYFFDCRQTGKNPDKAAALALLPRSKNKADLALRILMNTLHNAMTRLVIDNALSDPSDLYENLVLLDYCRKNNLDKHYNYLLKTTASALEDSPLRNDQWYENALDLEIQKYHMLSLSKRKQSLNLQQILNTIDILYFIKKLKYACYALSHQVVYKQDYDIAHLDWVREVVVDNGMMNHPAVNVYFHALEMLKDPGGDKAFESYKTVLENNQDIFPAEELRALYFFAINHCIKKLNSGSSEYGAIGLDLYSMALDNGVIYVDGFLSRFTYRNIAMMAIRSGRFNWAADFSHNYADKLRPGEKASAFHFNMAQITYHNKQYDASLEHLQLSDFGDHLIHLAAKTLQAKIYFEYGEYELMEYVLDTMDIYITRNKVIGYHKDNYKNITSGLRKLEKAVSPPDRKKIEKLKNTFNHLTPLTERAWLLRQLDGVSN